MRKFIRKTQLISTAATVLIAILLTIIVVKEYIIPSSKIEPTTITSKIERVPVNAQPNISTKQNLNPIGQPIPLKGIDWKNNKRTLVMFVSTTCHFCTESSSFYKRLINDTSVKDGKIIAVLPQTVDEAKAYLTDLGVNPDQIINAQLASIGVTATPTLLLVDESGKITDQWRGKLSSEQETQVINKMSS